MKDKVTDLDTILKELRKQGSDNAQYEVKECANELSKDVWESVSAFANTDSGVILLGISEKEGFIPIENFQIDKVCDQFMAGMGDGGTEGKLTNPPEYHIERPIYKEKAVLEIRISELDLAHKPCYITKRGLQGGSYKRIDDKDIKLSLNEIYSIQSATEVDVSDRHSIDGTTIDDLNSAVYEAAFTKALTVTPRAMRDANTTEERLKRLNFTNAKSQVIRADLLVAGVYPQQFFPKLHVDVAVHPGTEKGAGGILRFKDRTICEGTLGEMIEDALNAVAKNLKRTTVVEGSVKTDELELPEVVLREAVTNALVHRSYNDRFDGEAVAIDVFDDRVEITNPGGLWGKSKKDLVDGRSCCRNATIMKLMSLVPLPSGQGSPAEGNGSGLLLMVNEMKANGLKEPEFYPEIDHFKVVLKRPTEEAKSQRRVQKGEAFIESLLEQYGEMSIRELVEESGLSINQVRRRINKLIDEEAVEPTAPATSRHRKYRVKE